MLKKKTYLAQIKVDGPAPKKMKRLLKVLRASGVKFRVLPKELRDVTVAKTPADKLGQIKVKAFSGVQPSPSVEILKRFKETVGSYADITEKLEASGRLGEAEVKFIELMEKVPQRSLSRLVAEAGVRPSRLLKLYAEGAIALGKVSAAIEISRNQPLLVKDLLRNALDQEGACGVCLGTGVVKPKVTAKKETATCPRCLGTGKRMIPSKHKEFAMEKVLALGQMQDRPQKGGAVVNVQQNNVQVPGGSGFFSRVLKSTDEILYRQRFKQLPTGGHEDSQPAVEAEIVEPPVEEENVVSEDRS